MGIPHKLQEAFVDLLGVRRESEFVDVSDLFEESLEDSCARRLGLENGCVDLLGPKVLLRAVPLVCGDIQGLLERQQI